MDRPVKVGDVVRSEVVCGHRYINGRPHGFMYEPRFSVKVQFLTEDAAERFRAEILQRVTA